MAVAPEITVALRSTATVDRLTLPVRVVVERAARQVRSTTASEAGNADALSGLVGTSEQQPAAVGGERGPAAKAEALRPAGTPANRDAESNACDCRRCA